MTSSFFSRLRLPARAAETSFEMRHRVVSLLLMIGLTFVFFLFFNSRLFELRLLPAEGVTALEVQLIEVQADGSIALKTVVTPDVWHDEDIDQLEDRRYRVMLPPVPSYVDYQLYMNNQWSKMEFWEGDRLLSRKPFWDINLAPMFRYPVVQSLDYLAGSIDPKPLDIVVTTTAIGSGVFPTVWFGKRQQIQKASSTFFQYLPDLQTVTIALVFVLMMLIFFDSTMNGVGWGRLLIAFPHFFYALVFLSDSTGMSTLTYAKLTAGVTYLMAVVWVFKGLEAVGSTQLFRVGVSVFIGVVMTVPMFESEIVAFDYAQREIYDPLLALICSLLLLYVGWNALQIEQIGQRFLLYFCLASMYAAGFRDVLHFINGTEVNVRITTSMGFTLNSYVLFILVMIDMWKRPDNWQERDSVDVLE